MSAKLRRYILVPLLLMAFMAFWRLITGQSPDLWQMLKFLAIGLAIAFFANRDPVDVDAPPTRSDAGWAVVAVPFGFIGLGASLYQLVSGVDRGVIEISSSSDWTVSWADHPIGFAFTIVMLIITAAVMIAMLWYCGFTIREWMAERRAARGRI